MVKDEFCPVTSTPYSAGSTGAVLCSINDGECTVSATFGILLTVSSSKSFLLLPVAISTDAGTVPSASSIPISVALSSSSTISSFLAVSTFSTISVSPVPSASSSAAWIPLSLASSITISVDFCRSFAVTSTVASPSPFTSFSKSSQSSFSVFSLPLKEVLFWSISAVEVSGVAVLSVCDFEGFFLLDFFLDLLFLFATSCL